MSVTVVRPITNTIVVRTTDTTQVIEKRKGSVVEVRRVVSGPQGIAGPAGDLNQNSVLDLGTFN